MHCYWIFGVETKYGADWRARLATKIVRETPTHVMLSVPIDGGPKAKTFWGIIDTPLNRARVVLRHRYIIFKPSSLVDACLAVCARCPAVIVENGTPVKCRLSNCFEGSLQRCVHVLERPALHDEGTSELPRKSRCPGDYWPVLMLLPGGAA